jgi:hypothetical protein
MGPSLTVESVYRFNTPESPIKRKASGSFSINQHAQACSKHVT